MHIEVLTRGGDKGWDEHGYKHEQGRAYKERNFERIGRVLGLSGSLGVRGPEGDDTEV